MDPQRSYNFTCVSSFVRSVVKSFSQNWLINFFWFFAWNWGQMLKSDGTRFLWKIHFCPNLGKKGPKIGYFVFFGKFGHFFFLKPMKVLLILFVGVTRHALSTQNSKVAVLCNSSRKRLGINMIFCIMINVKVLYKQLVSLLLVLARHAASTQCSKFVISLQYVKKKRGVNLIFHMRINIKLSYKLLPLILVAIARPAQITQNNKVGKSYFDTILYTILFWNLMFSIKLVV